MSETNNSNEVVVSIKNLQKAFGDNVVLRDIDLDVHKGEVVVVLEIGRASCRERVSSPV